jgi:hypothetical protein
MRSAESSLTVLKVGGSLFDLGGLGERLARFLDHRPTTSFVIVPGGGIVIDAIQHLSRRSDLSAAEEHFLAVDGLRVTARWLKHTLAAARIPARLTDRLRSLRKHLNDGATDRIIAVLDTSRWLRWPPRSPTSIVRPPSAATEGADDLRPGSGGTSAEDDSDEPSSLPVGPETTTDSIAAEVARRCGTLSRPATLTLLKSVDPPSPFDLERAARDGLVDGHFPLAARGLTVEWINFRRWPEGVIQ